MEANIHINMNEVANLVFLVSKDHFVFSCKDFTYES